jgi:pyruvate dehydrogenase (quinone)
VDRPDDVAGAWDEAFSADRPVVYEAVVDPDVPPLPPHITTSQATAMARAVLKGDPDRGAMVRQTLRDLVEEFLPR